MNQYLTEFKKKCEKVLSLLRDDLATIKTGRAKPSLVEKVKVNVYDSWMEVREVASITAPDANTLELSVWDKSILKDFIKSLSEAEGNFNPNVSGDIVRIIIPPLTEEKRKELVKLVNQKLESHKTMVRQERNEAKKNIESMKGKSGVSEDDIKEDLEQMQEITDETVKKIEEIGKEKEEEIMQI